MVDFERFAQSAEAEDTVFRAKGVILENLEALARQEFGHGIVSPHSDKFVLLVESSGQLPPDRALTGPERFGANYCRDYVGTG